ncbi:MAG: arginase family protein [Ectothiorhodospiraceae bacterium]|nr:arginase family protein [Ectothiorhodospiraceae bacterium]
MGVQYSHDLSRSRAAVVGLPFDVGTDALRVGARHGPRAIRIQSGRVGHYPDRAPDIDPLVHLGVVDCGDVRLVPSELEAAREAIERAVDAVAGAGAVPYTMGGDGTVTLPQLRALAPRNPGMVVLHVDAHTDAVDGTTRAAATGTTFRIAAEEGLVDTAASMHVGVRGPFKGPGVPARSAALGYHTVTMSEFRRRGLDDVLAEIHDRMRGRPVYLCWDMDFFDPSVAPGVCAPTPGGASAHEGLALVDGLAGLDIVAVDVNTVSPPHDPAGTTALLAARVMHGAMTIAAV